MNILYVTPYVPSLIRTRLYNLIRALARLGHRVTLLTAAGTLLEEQAQAEDLRGYGVQTETSPISLTRSLVNCCEHCRRAGRCRLSTPTTHEWSGG